MTLSKLLLLLVVLAILAVIGAYWQEPEFAYVPSNALVLNRERGNLGEAYDLWGRRITPEEARDLLNTEEGRRQLTPQHGAVFLDETLLPWAQHHWLGRDTFYGTTYGNEVFFTDILGLLHGPLRPRQFAKALWKLRGRGTNDLQVELEESVTIGGRTFAQGARLSTGLDVPRGALVPLGVRLKFSKGRLQAGFTCAVCHAAVEPTSGLVIEGAPNRDLNMGWLLASAPNSAAYFTHADVSSLGPFTRQTARQVVTSSRRLEPLPDPDALEEAVDATLLRWPPGSFDTTADGRSNPTQIPDVFTLGEHPYGWTGWAAAGPFQGLSVLTDAMHVQTSDPLARTELGEALFHIDPELSLGTMLQRAAEPAFRFDPSTLERPSTFFAAVDPTPGTPGVTELVRSPNNPKLSWVAPEGLFSGSPGHRVWEQSNALAAWQQTLVPPSAGLPVDPKVLARGRGVFEQARCLTCHAGRALTNNRVIPVEMIGTDPSRALALRHTEPLLGPAATYGFDTLIPPPPGAHVLMVPVEHLDAGQARLAWAHGGTAGGYKVPGLLGLYWSAPYLHDGGVAVGPELQTQAGVPGTLLRGVLPDAANSLRALIDRSVRQRVIQANERLEELRHVHVSGRGHEFWVDSASGFTPQEQDALIQYLLSLTKPNT